MKVNGIQAMKNSIKTYLITDDQYLLNAIKHWIPVEWSGDSIPFLFKIKKQNKFFIIIDSRIARKDYMRFKEKHPDNVFVLFINFSTMRLKADNKFYDKQIDGNTDLVIFVTNLNVWIQEHYRKKVKCNNVVHITKKEKKIFYYYIKYNYNIRLVARILNLTERNTRNHLCNVSRRFGFSNFLSFLIFNYSVCITSLSTESGAASSLKTFHG